MSKVQADILADMTAEEKSTLDEARTEGVDWFLHLSDSPNRWAVRNLPFGADAEIIASREAARCIAKQRNAVS